MTIIRRERPFNVVFIEWRPCSNSVIQHYVYAYPDLYRPSVPPPHHVCVRLDRPLIVVHPLPISLVYVYTYIQCSVFTTVATAVIVKLLFDVTRSRAGLSR